ncbi:MAG TPA: phenylacetate--CoA ligase family protein [Streptosporangiaceae bacterium]|nr:phenylacetate--CoA ligase family protein [Streptosporangiaceae bacterium]
MDSVRGQRVGEALADFCARPPVPGLPCDPDAVEVRLLELFHRVAGSVPAYQDFLREHGVDPAGVRTFADFCRLPLTTKENYHWRYPLARRCRDGRLESCDMIAVSSGSTGRPTYWPRFLPDELAAAARFEQVFHDSFEADRRSTLAVVCFPLGTWVGGLYTASCCRHLALKGYPITVVAPGNDKEEILRVAPELAPGFAQTVLLGYPPFLKDVIDTGTGRGVSWASLNVKLVLAGEVFSEDWRDLVGSRAGMRRPAYDSAALYGTADAGVLGNETPLSVTIRRFLARTPQATQALFGQSRLPTLVQYDPLSRFFEARDGTLLFSGDNGVPLIRYHIADEGGTLAYEEMLAHCKEYGFDPLVSLGGGRGSPPLPFVYVFGRSHFTMSFFGANIYPENIAAGLEQPTVSGWVTGKFVLEVAEDADYNRHLAIAVELAPGEHGSTGRRALAAESIRTQLNRLNSEFAHYVPGDYQTPRVTLLPTGDPQYFPRGVKHRYTRKPGEH